MRTLILLLAALLLPAVLLAGVTGKITGTIAEKGSGESLAGATILLAGTQYGAAAGIDGRYFILNVPPGVYNLRTTMVGYGTVVVKDIRVVADQTTTVDVRLETAAVGMDEVVVQAERPMVQRDATASITVLNSEQIRMMPVKDYVEVLQMQAGVVSEGRSLFVRGGRSNEVAYLIDGMYVKDPVLGAAGTTIHNDAISELVFLSGTFNAEYGNALSGVVNIVTREGGSSYNGSIEGRTSEFGVKPFSTYREDRASATLSGPLAGEHLTAFVSGERDARGSWLPFGYDRTISAIGKLSSRVLSDFKVTASWRYTENEHQPYNHSWKYIPEQYLKIREKSRHGVLSATHSVLPNLFYDVRFSYFNQSYYSGVDKDTSQYIPIGSERYFPNIGTGFEFYAQRDPIEVTDNRTETFDVRGDVTWQVGRDNEVRAGFEFKKHKLNFFDVYDPKRDHPYVTQFYKKPVEMAGYLQDKIELNALVINLGLRFDYADQKSPFRSNPLDASSVVPSKSKTQWSPRLGVAHPISDRTSLHFSYGHFFQNPDYSRLFENSQYDISVREPLFGQPDLDAERTTSYEVGVTHQFGQYISGSFTAYYKDVLGLVGTQYLQPYTAGRYVGYTLYVNEAYANIKAFEVRLTMRRSKYLAGVLTYTYSVAKGSASSEQEDYPGTTTSTLLYPLDWDRTHMVNANVSLSFPRDDGPRIFGAFPLAETYWNVIVRASSGRPYTPSGRRLSGYVEKNSGRYPMTFSVDAEFGKAWTLSPFTVEIFAEILNLTGQKNVISIWTDTGEPDVTYESTHSQEYLQDPSNYGPPRRIRLGARLRF